MVFLCSLPFFIRQFSTLSKKRIRYYENNMLKGEFL
nr:MAG TPA: hypothetical protein [Caudoviricetes sp.]